MCCTNGRLSQLAENRANNAMVVASSLTLTTLFLNNFHFFDLHFFLLLDNYS